MGADRILAGLLLAAGVAAGARAQEPEVATDGHDDLEISVACPWPDEAVRGYAPVRVELRNRGDREETVRLEFHGNGAVGSTSLVEHVTLAPGGRETRDVVVPLLGAPVSNLYMFWIGSFGGRHIEIDGVPGNAADRFLLFVTEDPESTPYESRGSAEGGVSLERGLQRLASRIKSPNRGDPDGLVTVFTSRHWLPVEAACYTSVDVVAVDEDLAPLEPAQLEALLTWVRMGGKAAFFAQDYRTFPETIPGVEAWNEARFLIEEGDGWFALRHGTGRLYFARGPALGAVVLSESFERFVTEHDWAFSLRRASRGVTWPDRATISDVGAISRRSAALLLLLFVLLIGPVNSFVLRRLRRPMLMLVTVPAAALLTSIAFVAYGIVHQGIDVKSASLSASLLDQRSHRSTTLELRELFAGLVLGRGLVPGPGTVVSPFLGSSEEMQFLSGSDRSKSFSIDAIEGRVLGGDFLPPRTEARQILLSDCAARQRVELRRAGDRLFATNGLGDRISTLLVCDARGGLHLGGPIDAGTEAPLEPWDPDTQPIPDSERMQDVLWFRNAVSDALPGSDGNLLAATYAARLERSPFTDPTGLELSEMRGTHVVVGILDLAGEEWR